jgi:hypothetical protein
MRFNPAPCVHFQPAFLYILQDIAHASVICQDKWRRFLSGLSFDMVAVLLPLRRTGKRVRRPLRTQNPIGPIYESTESLNLGVFSRNLAHVESEGGNA